MVYKQVFFSIYKQIVSILNVYVTNQFVLLFMIYKKLKKSTKSTFNTIVYKTPPFIYCWDELISEVKDFHLNSLKTIKTYILRLGKSSFQPLPILSQLTSHYFHSIGYMYSHGIWTTWYIAHNHNSIELLLYTSCYVMNRSGLGRRGVSQLRDSSQFWNTWTWLFHARSFPDTLEGHSTQQQSWKSPPVHEK